MKIFFIRHGETDWNREGRLQGRTETMLTEEGLRQADRAAEAMARHELEAVISSPLARARATAMKIFGAQHGAKFDTDDDLAEISHGDWEGMRGAEIAERWPDEWQFAMRCPHAVVFPGAEGESLAGVRRRAVRAIDRIRERYSRDVAVVSHGGVIKVLLMTYLDMPLSSMYRFQVANCSISTVEFREDRPPRVLAMGCEG